MSWISLFAIYFILWWLCLFMVLPFGVRSQDTTDDAAPGTDPGAPLVPHLAWKLLATTVLAAVLMALVVWALSSPMLQEYWS